MIGDILRKLREENKLGQKDIANELNITPGAYSLYEVGKREPDIEALIILANFYNVSVDYLLGRTNIRNLEVKDVNLSDYKEFYGLSTKALDEIKVFIDYVKSKYKKD